MSSANERVELIEAIGQVVMTWLAFLTTGVVTLFFLGFFVWCVAKDRGMAATSITGVLNGFLLSLLTIIFRSLFPGPSQKTT